MRRSLSILALCAITVSLPARADYPAAPDVVVFCEPTLRPAVTDLGARWEAETGIPVRIFAAPTSANFAQLAHHTRDDVIIGEGDAKAAAAISRNLIKAGTIQKLWRNRLVVAAEADMLEKSRAASPPHPLDLASLAGKMPIAIVDPAVAEAGIQTKNALQALGLWDAIRRNSVGVVDTADAAFLLSQGKVKLAILYATDVSADPNFAIADALSAADGQSITYWAAQTQGALSPNSAKFLDFLRRPDIREQGRRAGLEVLP